MSSLDSLVASPAASLCRPLPCSVGPATLWLLQELLPPSVLIPVPLLLQLSVQLVFQYRAWYFSIYYDSMLNRCLYIICWIGTNFWNTWYGCCNLFLYGLWCYMCWTYHVILYFYQLKIAIPDAAAAIYFCMVYAAEAYSSVHSSQAKWHLFGDQSRIASSVVRRLLRPQQRRRNR
jgi:hypothetical protein